MIIAPKLKFGRRPRTSGLHPRVNKCIEKDAERFNCSKSFVIATILAYHYNVTNEGNFRHSGK